MRLSLTSSHVRSLARLLHRLPITDVIRSTAASHSGRCSPHLKFKLLSTHQPDAPSARHISETAASVGNGIMAALQHAVQKPQELVAIVDRDNNVVSSATRKEMRDLNLIHRASFTIVFNTQIPGMQREIFVQKRVAFKETFPSFYDPAPGGVVGAGESYEDNAVAELREEMGITGVTLQRHFDFYFEGEGLRMWGALFSCVYDGELVLQPEEVESGEWMRVQDVKKLLRTQQVCPDSKAAVLRYFDSIDRDAA